MIRLNINFTPRQRAAIQAEAERLGLKFSEMHRRILDEWVEKQENKNEGESK